MKKILITGANSYVGTSFEKYLSCRPDEYEIHTLDMLDDSWKSFNFSGYDTVYHVAGIAHSDSGKITKEKELLYKTVNTDLTIEVAKKAKADGVEQFIFMSSMIVYGNSGKIGCEKVITKNTPPCPANVYGLSKLNAENGIRPLEDDSFKVCIIRSPMIYGKGCKGNFSQLEKFAFKMNWFPFVKNQRSMLYIGNLVEFVKLLIDNREGGLFFPQNAEYSNTSVLVQSIAKANGKKIRLVKGFGWALKLLSLTTRLVDKAFGNLTYEPLMSEYKTEYRIYNLTESIEETEKQ